MKFTQVEFAATEPADSLRIKAREVYASRVRCNRTLSHAAPRPALLAGVRVSDKAYFAVGTRRLSK